MTNGARTWARLLLAVLASTLLAGLLARELLLERGLAAPVLFASAAFSAQLLFVYVWLLASRPQDRAWLWYGTTTACWTAALVTMWLEQRGAPMPAALADTVRLAFLLACFQLVRVVIEDETIMARRALRVGAIAVLLLPLIAELDPRLGAVGADVLQLVLRLGGLWIVWRLVRYALGTASREAHVLLWLGCSAIPIGFGPLWDWLVPGLDPKPMLTPLIGLGMALLLVVHLLEATERAEALTQDLEARVRRRTEALRERHARVRELERDQAVQSERERIMRDVHDGIGGQLVAALAALRALPAQGAGQLAQHLRQALLDLRLMIDSLDERDGDLTALLADFRNRTQGLVDATGVRTTWRIERLPPRPDLGPGELLDVLRILQEAITNALRHAGAGHVGISSTHAEDGVRVRVTDDGRGFDPGEPVSGRGIANMRTRARRIGAVLSMESSTLGTTLVLFLPHPTAPDVSLQSDTVSDTPGKR